MTEASRAEFLRTVSRALGRDEPPSEAPAPPSGRPTLAELEERAAAIHERLEAHRGDLMEALVRSAEAAGWRVTRAPTPEAARQYVTSLARERGMRRVIRTSHPVLARLELDSALSDVGVQVNLLAGEAGLSPQEARQAAADADLGLTGVDYAIAALGSCVLRSREGVSRLASLLSPVHLAIVELAQIVESLDDLFTLLSLEALRSGDPGSYTSLITGPSRTADIEQTLIVGVHGPQEVHLVLLEG